MCENQGCGSMIAAEGVVGAPNSLVMGSLGTIDSELWDFIWDLHPLLRALFRTEPGELACACTVPGV